MVVDGDAPCPADARQRRVAALRCPAPRAIVVERVRAGAPGRPSRSASGPLMTHIQE